MLHKKRRLGAGRHLTLDEQDEQFLAKYIAEKRYLIFIPVFSKTISPGFCRSGKGLWNCGIQPNLCCGKESSNKVHGPPSRVRKKISREQII